MSNARPDNSAHDSRPRVAVLYGGESPQREMSLESGIQVAAALEEAGCSVQTIDPSEIDLRDIDWRGFDLAYIALPDRATGGNSAQSLLEALRVPYCGSDAATSEIAGSKHATKKRLLAHGVPTAPWHVVTDDQTPHDWFQLVAPLGFPLIVKPDGEGGGLGVGKADDADQLQVALAESLLYDPCSLVEPFLAGREFAVGVVNRQTLPLLEVVDSDPNQDRTLDPQPAAVEYRTAAECSTDMATQVKRVAIQACEALGTAGLVQVDLRYDLAGRVYVLEVNANPSLALECPIPRMARLADLSLAELCFGLVEQALVSISGGTTG